MIHFYQFKFFKQGPGDRIVKILNRGWYVASLQAYYELQDNPYSRVGVQQRGSIAKNQDFAFYIPGTVDVNTGAGIVISADAVLGVRIFSIRILSSPTCIHIWGTTLIPFWTYVDCRLF